MTHASEIIGTYHPYSNHGQVLAFTDRPENRIPCVANQDKSQKRSIVLKHYVTVIVNVGIVRGEIPLRPPIIQFKVEEAEVEYPEDLH